MKKILSVLCGIAICMAVGFVSRLFHETAMVVWYPTLRMSVLTPSDLAFPVVWGILYLLLGISLGLLWAASNIPLRRPLLWLFGLQLALHLSWNILFFYMRDPALGLINLIALDLTGVLFFAGALRVKRNVAWLFLPYLVWILFATYLNLYILLNN